MNPALLLPVIFGVALLVGAFTGHVAPEQLAAGAALLLAPGADRFAPLLRQLLRPAGGAPAAPGQPGLLTLPTEEVHRLAGVAYESYAAATGGKTFDGRPMPTWEEARARIGHAWAAAVTGVLSNQANQPILRLVPPAPPPPPAAPPSLPPIALLLLLLPLLALAPSCASWPAWRSALAACGVQVAPAGVQSGVALALHKGEGWTEALGELVSLYGGCLVKAQVQAHADGAGADPPRAQAETAPLATLIGGELAAGPSAVTRAEAQQRAAAWLRGHR